LVFLWFFTEQKRNPCQNKNKQDKQHHYIDKRIGDVSVDEKDKEGICDEKPNANKTKKTSRPPFLYKSETGKDKKDAREKQHKGQR